MRFQLARFVPPQLFARQPAGSLQKSALHLSAVQGRVERPADVVKDVHAQQAALARQRVHRHFGHRRAVREIEIRPAVERRAVEVDAGREVIARGAQLDAREVGFAHQRRKLHHRAAERDPAVLEPHRLGRDAVPRDRKVDEPLPDGARCGLRGLPVQVAARGGGRRGGIGDLARVRAGDAHAPERDAQFLRNHLRDLGVEALTHLGAAVVEQHRAVGVDVEQGARLVEVRGVERNAELHRRHRDAALYDRAAPR